MHPLLQRQLRRYLGENAALPQEWLQFLSAVSDAYTAADEDLAMRERSMELMSQELTQRNRDLRRELGERRQVEAALRSSEARLARAQRAGNLASWEWWPERDAYQWSAESHRLFGAAADALSDRPLLDLVHPDDRALVASILDASRAQVAPFNIDFRVVCEGGAVRFVHSQGEWAAAEADQEAHQVGVMYDVTARKQAELALEREKAEQASLIRELAQTQQQLIQSEKLASLGQLAAGVAHEINNPIGYVQSNLGTLERYVSDLLAVLTLLEEGERPAAIEPALRTAWLERLTRVKRAMDIDYIKADIPALLADCHEGIGRVKKIVLDLKNFSRDESAEEWQAADLHDGLESTLNIVHNEIKYHARVVKEYGDLPTVECLPSQLNQVFMNLLVNAAQSMPEGKLGTITIATGTGAGEAWVEIADTGKGIAPEHLGRIFDPFFTTKPVGKGTGLGLSLSYGIVRKHNGRIEVQSVPGIGTRFRVVVPLVQRQERQRAAMPAPHA